MNECCRERNAVIGDLKSELSALTEERDKLKMEVECEERRFSDLWEQFCSVVAEKDRYKWTLKQILGWRELRETQAFPIERVEEITRDALALSSPPSAVREAEREVIRAAEEWADEQGAEPEYLCDLPLIDAVRALRSLREG